MLKGKLVYLRLLNPTDVDKVFAWENDPENWKVSDTTVPYTKEIIEEFVNAPQDIFVHNQLRLIICLNETNEAIGAIDFFEFDAIHQRCGVGLLIEPNQRKKGYGLEALSLIEPYASKEIGIRNLFANILIDNEGSIQVFEKAGYLKVGHKKNWFNDHGNLIDELMYQKELNS